MIKLALYVIEDAHDAAMAGRHEIYDFVINDSECESCGMVIGPSEDEFFPCVLIQDVEEVLGEDTWPICIDCAAPLVYPNEWVITLNLE
jgi:hypothetical protein